MESIEAWATVRHFRSLVDTLEQPDGETVIHTIIDCVLNAERSKRATTFMLSSAKEFMICKRITNFDTPDAAGNTPLQRAMNAKHTELVELLLELGHTGKANEKGKPEPAALVAVG